MRNGCCYGYIIRIQSLSEHTGVTISTTERREMLRSDPNTAEVELSPLLWI